MDLVQPDKNNMKTNIINWLEAWAEAQLDGDWEHEHGVQIAMLDNPGWSLTIDLINYESSLIDIPYILEKRDTQWMGCKISNSYLSIFSDIRNLSTILVLFQKIIETLDSFKIQNQKITKKEMDELIKKTWDDVSGNVSD